jgi:hypothetical protein
VAPLGAPVEPDGGLPAVVDAPESAPPVVCPGPVPAPVVVGEAPPAAGEVPPEAGGAEAPPSALPFAAALKEERINIYRYSLVVGDKDLPGKLRKTCQQ